MTAGFVALRLRVERDFAGDALVILGRRDGVRGAFAVRSCPRA